MRREFINDVISYTVDFLMFVQLRSVARKNLHRSWYLFGFHYPLHLPRSEKCFYCSGIQPE
jgi:hypothetical protein